VGSTRTSTPATLAAIDKLKAGQVDCYKHYNTAKKAPAISEIKKLSPSGQAEYYRAQGIAAIAREIRLAAGKQETDPCADTARAYYALLDTRERGKWSAIGTGLKVVGLGLGIYATGNAIATVVGAAAAGGGDRIVNIGGTRGSSSAQVPAVGYDGLKQIPVGSTSSSGDDSITLSDVVINQGDRSVVGRDFTVSGPIGFDNFRWMSGSGFIGSGQPFWQTQPRDTTNTIQPKNSKKTGILN